LKALGRAVSLYALRRLREARTKAALAACRGNATYRPKLLYESVGFRQPSRIHVYRRSRGHGHAT
jgi:hypothetical protein